MQLVLLMVLAIALVSKTLAFKNSVTAGVRLFNSRLAVSTSTAGAAGRLTLSTRHSQCSCHV